MTHIERIPFPPHPIDRADDSYESGWADGYSRARTDLRACTKCHGDRIDRSFYFGDDRPCPDCATRPDASFHDPEAEPCHRCGDTGYILTHTEQGEQQ